MIHDLIIKNIVLVETCSISFSEKLNVITGETGAGKTALLQALKLLSGQKLDVSWIRKGEMKGSIQARFSLPSSSSFVDLLEESGVPIEEEVLLYREISSEGKSKSYINGHMTSLSLLQKASSYLFQIIDQHSYHELRSSHAFREYVDLYGNLKEDLTVFTKAYHKMQELQSAFTALQEKEQKKEYELHICRIQKEELTSCSLGDEQEEQIFQEYTILSRAQEISAKTDELLLFLSQSPHAILPKLSQCKSLCDSLSSLHASFAESSSLCQQAILSLQEVTYLLRSPLASFDLDPSRLEFLEKTLNKIEKIKKKYGESAAQRIEYLNSLQKKIEEFELLEQEKETITALLEEHQITLNKYADILTKKRSSLAKELAEVLTREIQSLNMIGAEIKMEREPEARTASGEDSISCFLSANPGEHPVSVKESSSGGELSRLLFAMKVCLAEKNNTPTLIFDEIDANVGGKTATLIGEKLQNLSQYRQILCITHFPQVAAHGDLHIQVRKEEVNHRTVAQVNILQAKEKEQELLRMLGGEKTLSMYAGS